MKTNTLFIRKFFVALTLLLSSSLALAVDPVDVERELTGDGAVGWIHGATGNNNLFVFTYRNPDNFFDFMIFSLVEKNPAVLAKMKTLSRHDKVRIKGVYLDNPSPQKHIEVSSIDVIEKFDPKSGKGPYQHEARIPDELNNVDEALFLVHALFAEGQIMVVEYKDVVLPVYVKNKDLTRNLWRGDLVKLKFRIQKDPTKPVHLRLNERVDSPVQVIESIREIHGKPGTIEGALIMFPKSPEIIFNVFAVQQKLQGGLNRQFTLVNFDDPQVFAQIRQKLQAAWDRHPGAFVNGRNKFVSTRIRVRATGILNEVDANQANPQVLLKSADDIVILD